VLIVDLSEVKLPGEDKQNNLPPNVDNRLAGVFMVHGQLIDGGVHGAWTTD
jgi:hypothetical protein